MVAMNKYSIVYDDEFDKNDFLIGQKEVKIYHGFVYTIRIKDSNIFKIGKSINPKNRIKQLEYMTSHKLELLALMATFDMDLLERAIQGNHKSCALPQSEWFVWPTDIMKSYLVVPLCEKCYFDDMDEIKEWVKLGDKILYELCPIKYTRKQGKERLGFIL